MFKKVLTLAAVAALVATFAPSANAAGEEAFRLWSHNEDGDEVRTKFISIPFAHIYRSSSIGETYSEGSIVDVTLLHLWGWEKDGDYSRWSILGNPFIKVIQNESDGEASGSFDVFTIESGREGGDVGSLFQRWHEGDRSGVRVLMFGSGRDSRIYE